MVDRRTKILFLGDSFTWGASAKPITNCFVDIVTRRGYLTFNTGIPGTGLNQYVYIAEKYIHAEDMFFIGRGYLYPAALEGALKIKEISYIHAEGYHAAELKHGPIALLEEKVPVVALANDIPGKDKIIGNMQECKARKSPVIATATIGDDEIKEHADDIIWLPRCSKYVAPIISVVALQFFSYYFAKLRGCSIDQPRNLAKSVTVE